MAAQTPERLIYQGETLALCSEPLGQLHELLAKKSWRFCPPDPSLRRGYVGTWRIEDKRLYLVKFHARVKESQKLVFISIVLEDLFPDYSAGVFAHWFTGELRCPSSRSLNFEDGGFGNTNDEDLFLRVNRGVVVEERRARNGVASLGASGERNGTMSVLASAA